jgi:pimeloyl-ACP methyl ester carboxylesterase
MNPRVDSRPIIRIWVAAASVLFVLGFGLAGTAHAEGFRLTVRLSESVVSKPYTGRVYVFASTHPMGEPRTHVNWFNPGPILSVEVKGVAPGDSVVFTPDLTGLYTFPSDAGELALAGLRLQAVARLNPFEREPNNGPGNGVSNPVLAEANSDGVVTHELVIDRLIPRPEFKETKWTKLLRVRSEMLSRFHGRDVYMNAAVTLPASYEEQPDRRYPVILNIPGFGGTHFGMQRNDPVIEDNDHGVEFLRVALDPSCPRGHHVFADSENNGPVGQALVTEFIPELDRVFRTVAAPTARFVTGHSSGGWSSLWLQVTYPDLFGGVWSTAPDPVDFRDFQQVNLYEPGANLHRTPAGERRPLARANGRVLLWYADFDRFEEALGYGGQLRSFEAVFSPRGADGLPRQAWNHQTGEVDLETTKTWEKYDIRLVLERNWTELGPKLAGKLHVFMGEADTFYLEGATRLLGVSLKSLGSDAVVLLVPGKDHGNLLDSSLRKRIRNEMALSFLKHHPR